MQYKEITCPCCDALFKIMLPPVYPVEIRSCDDLSEEGQKCHYCKNSLLLVPHPTEPHPTAKVCVVCHLYQP